MDIEAVLYFDKLNEDSRNYGTKYRGETVGAPDWRLYSGQGYGQRVLSALGAPKGYSWEVTDLGKSIAVRASYHNAATGRGVSKTYVILFDEPGKGGGNIFASSTRWRSVTNPEQAASYISMSIKGYANSTGAI